MLKILRLKIEFGLNCRLISFILSETQTFEEEQKVVEAPISDVVVIGDEISNSEIVTNVSDIQTK